MAKKQPRFQLVRSVDKQFFFRFISKNGSTIATSETYKRKAGARRGIMALYPDWLCPFEIEDLT